MMATLRRCDRPSGPRQFEIEIPLLVLLGALTGCHHFHGSSDSDADVSLADGGRLDSSADELDGGMPDSGSWELVERRLLITPAAMMLPGQGAKGRLQARAADAAGVLLDLAEPPSWSSSAPDVVAVSSDGELEALAGAGTALITARAGELTSDPVVVLVARPVEGAVLLSDDQLLEGPTPLLPEQPVAPGWRARVVVAGGAATGSLAPGAIVLSTGELPVGGRVVALEPADAGSADVALTLELLPLPELLPELTLDLHLEPAALSPEPNPELGDARVLRNAEGRLEVRLAGRTELSLEESPDEDEPEPAGKPEQRKGAPAKGDEASGGAQAKGDEDGDPSPEELAGLLHLDDFRWSPTLEVDLQLRRDQPFRLLVFGGIQAHGFVGIEIPMGLKQKLSKEILIGTLAMPPLPGVLALFVDIHLPIEVLVEAGGQLTLCPPLKLGWDWLADLTVGPLGMECSEPPAEGEGDGASRCRLLPQEGELDPLQDEEPMLVLTPQAGFSEDGEPASFTIDPSFQMELTAFAGVKVSGHAAPPLTRRIEELRSRNRIVHRLLGASKVLDVELFALQVGVEQQITLAPAVTQASGAADDARLAATARMSFGAGEDVEDFLERLRLELDLTADLLAWELDRFPPSGRMTVTGVHGSNPQALHGPRDDDPVGDVVRFDVTLDDTTFLGAELVEGIQLWWMRAPREGEQPCQGAAPGSCFACGAAGQGGVCLVPPGSVFERGPHVCTFLPASVPGQRSFSCTTGFVPADQGTSTVHAFLQTRLPGLGRLLPLRLGPEASVSLRFAREDEEQPVDPNGHLVLTYDSFDPDVTLSGRYSCGIHLYLQNLSDQRLDQVNVKLAWPEINTVLSYSDLEIGAESHLEYRLAGMGCRTIEGARPTIEATTCRLDGATEETCRELFLWLGHRDRPGQGPAEPAGNLMLNHGVVREQDMFGNDICTLNVALQNSTPFGCGLLHAELAWPDGHVRVYSFTDLMPGNVDALDPLPFSCDTADSGRASTTFLFCHLDGVWWEDCMGLAVAQ